MVEQRGDSAAAAFADRSRALAVFGWLEIVLGCLCALLVPLIFLANQFTVRSSVGVPTTQRLLSGALFYLALAAVFITLGIGSIRGRRWARALTLIWGWLWLLGGALGLVLFVWVMGKTIDAVATRGQGGPVGGCIFFVTFLILAVILVLLPLVLVLFYRRRDVKLTVETKNPRPRWTDKAPLPVLALSVILAAGALACPVSLLSVGAFPVFGRLITGWPAVVVILGMAALLAALAWAVYRLKPAGWWGTLILQLFGVANFGFLGRPGFEDLMKAMGYSTQEIEITKRYYPLNDIRLLGLIAVSWLIWFGFILFLRKYFPPSASKARV